MSVLLLDLCGWIFNMAREEIPFQIQKQFLSFSFWNVTDCVALLLRYHWKFEQKLKKRELWKRFLILCKLIIDKRGWKNHSGAPLFAQSWQRSNTHIKDEKCKSFIFLVPASKIVLLKYVSFWNLESKITLELLCSRNLDNAPTLTLEERKVQKFHFLGKIFSSSKIDKLLTRLQHLH